MREENDGPANVYPSDGRMCEDAWNAVAPQYATFWSSRLEPFRRRAVEALHPVPQGLLAVPGCGPGNEVLLLAKAFPDRSVVATDGSHRMLALLLETLRKHGMETVVPAVGSAGDLSAFVRQAAAVLSCFTLDALPDPIAALADWSLCLRDGASITAIFWPRPPPGSARALLEAVVETRLGYGRPLWEENALQALQQLSLELVRDERIRCEISYGDPDEYFRGMIDTGPLHFLREMFGEKLLRECRDLWLVHHGLEQRDGGWTDPAEARLWVLKRSVR